MADNKEWYMGNDFIEEANDNHEWQDILCLTIDKAMEKTHVATLGFVVSKEPHNICGRAKVKPFPLDMGQEEYVIDVCYNDVDLDDLKNGDIVVVLFMDKNFNNNLNYDSPKQVNTEILHNISQGVIISRLIKKSN